MPDTLLVAAICFTIGGFLVPPLAGLVLIESKFRDLPAWGLLILWCSALSASVVGLLQRLPHVA